MGLLQPKIIRMSFLSCSSIGWSIPRPWFVHRILLLHFFVKISLWVKKGIELLERGVVLKEKWEHPYRSTCGFHNLYVRH